MAEDLASLLAPTTVQEFFGRYYEREPLHREGPATRGGELLTATAFHSRVEAADREARSAPRATAGATNTAPDVEQHLSSGKPLVWDDAVGLSPSIDRLCLRLSESFGALVWPNVYSTSDAGSPFTMHFDPHETLIVQCEGEKLWQLSTLRARLPLDDTPEADAQARGAIRQAAELASTRVQSEIVTTPGDVLYLPRGLFHAASATSGRSLHVTFGIRPPVGFELTTGGPPEIRDDALFREFLPGPAADPDGKLSRAHLARLRERLEELGHGGTVHDDVAERRAALRERSRHPAAEG